MARFKSIVFYQYSPKIKLILKKMQKFQALGDSPPDPRASGGWGLGPQTPSSLWRLGAPPPDPKTAPAIANFGAMFRPHFALCIIVWGFVAFVLNSFFFIIQLQTF